ncbi:MAG: hypothetical protein JST28_09995 [Acidobacteria bacterium]|nr:hypothetical protein [Acidobacteriota bacterium]
MNLISAGPAKTHQWAATGVSGYPLTHPIVGQGQFFETFRQFIHIVDAEQEGFAHVFSVVAPWGIGKSRLGYELIAQINDASRGWFVRDSAAELKEAQLFYDDKDREQYLGLYLRYSQIANEYQNIDNWFGYGLYKALLPLTRDTFDNSIQGQIAREAYDRLIVLGFDSSKLAEAMEVSAGHSDEKLYEDDTLVTRLCEAAYKYLAQFGIKYLLIVLDELETAAEAATFGLEREDLKYLDGRAIKLLGKAIKEEDPRRKLPWLRYVALCSPAIGDELREIQSTARRFELVDLTPNSFADVSDFVERLREAGRLPQKYLPGLVEAAYTMSGGNFGWFNVIMANVDGLLRDPKFQGKNAPATIGELFENAVRVSNRLRDHVLDYNALDELKLAKAFASAARDLIYGQLPVPLKAFTAEQREALLNARNEYDEPVATLYARVEWDEKACTDVLRGIKAKRDKDRWLIPGVDEPLDLRQLLANLSTYAIHEIHGKQQEPGRYTLLIPLLSSDFVQLVSMLYPHPASPDVARALWASFVGEEVSASSASYIGPSVAMLGRVNLRYRKQTHNSLIFRDPADAAALEAALAARKGQSEEERAKHILTGVMRSLDDNWDYEPVSPGLKSDVAAIVTQSGKGKEKGLVRFDGLKLHPEGRVILAYVRSEAELVQLADATAAQFDDEGRTPVLAFTSSRTLGDRLASAPAGILKDAQEFLTLYWLNQNEEQILQQIGLPKSSANQLIYRPEKFTTQFSNRLQSLLRSLKTEIYRWRIKLNELGRIAWPFRPGAAMADDDRKVLIEAWIKLLVEPPQPRRLEDLDSTDGISPQEVLSVLKKMSISQRAASAGYQENERAGLFSSLEDTTEPGVPAFLLSLVERLLKGGTWSYADAKRQWFWGYVWEGSRTSDTFEQWMALACSAGYAEFVGALTGKPDRKYQLIERKKIRNAITEADNWLAGDYAEVVDKLELVFGEGKVRDYFGPLGSKKPGSKTIEGKNKLNAASALLDELDIQEAAPSRDAGRLLRGAKLRIEARRYVDMVYDRDEYQKLSLDDANLKTLNFEDDRKPLWQRIRRAEIFANYALLLKDRIINQAAAVASEMESAVKPWPKFPTALFKRSLDKIQNILTGALEVKELLGTTQNLQATEPGTLKQSLRDLRIGEALGKLQQLAREVGLDGAGASSLKLDQIEGQIVGGFHELRRAYQQLHERLENYTNQIAVLSRVLKTQPDDFAYPKDIPSFTGLIKQPSEIRSELEESIFDDIETLFEEHEHAAQLGNFQPLMSAAKDLLRSPTVALNKLGGFIVTLENQVTEYRARLLGDPQLQETRAAINGLRATRGEPAHRPLDMTDLEAEEGLDSAKSLVRARLDAWRAEGEELLASSGVSFTRWRTVVAALAKNQEPDLNVSEADELVKRAFLRRTYALVGGSSE